MNLTSLLKSTPQMPNRQRETPYPSSSLSISLLPIQQVPNIMKMKLLLILDDIKPLLIFIISKHINSNQSMSKFLINEELQSQGSNYNADELSLASDDGDYSLKKNYYIKKSKNRGRRYKNGAIGGRHNQSLWNIQENTRYMNFLLEKGQLFNSNSIQRKAIKINVQMSDTIKTRSPDQCRSHHQKMMKHHKDVPRIIQHIQKLLRNGERPLCDKSIDSQSRTEFSPSLKDLSNFQPSSNWEQSIWNQLLNSLVSEEGRQMGSGSRDESYY